MYGVSSVFILFGDKCSQNCQLGRISVSFMVAKVVTGWFYDCYLQPKNNSLPPQMPVISTVLV